jgi:hypothetical protein
MTGDENNRHVGAFDRKAFLQFKTVQTWERKVEDKTARNRGSWMIEEFLCGRECLRLPVLIPDQQFQ